MENVGWVGSLDFMSPFKGYKLFFQKSDELNYPISINTGRYGQLSYEDIYFDLPKGWEVTPTAYQHSMSITGTIVGNLLAENEGQDVIGVFVNDKLRGYDTAEALKTSDAQTFFLSSFSEEVTGEQLTFKYYQYTQRISYPHNHASSVDWIKP